MPSAVATIPTTRTKTTRQVTRAQNNEKRLQEAGEKLFDHAVLINLTFNRPTVTKGVRGAKKLEVLSDREDVPNSELEVSKRIMKWPEYLAVAAKESAIRAWVRKNSCQGKLAIFKNGCYVVPMTNIQKVIDYLEEQEPEYEELVDILTEAYPLRKLQDKRILKSQYSESDYPNVLKFRRAFGMDYFTSTIQVPNQLEGVAPEIFAIESKKAKQRLTSWATNMEQGLAEAVQEVWQYLWERFNPEKTATGKQKSIKAEAMDKVMETVQRLKTLNMTNEPLIESQLEELEQLISSTNIKDMKKDPIVRQNILTASETAIKALDSILEDAPTRKISRISKEDLEDEDELW